MCLKPETLATLARQSARLLGITPKQFVEAALKSPVLFTRKPESLAANIKGYSEVLRLSRAETIGVILRQPSLLAYRPATIRRKLALIGELAVANDRGQSARAIIMEFPTVLCYGESRLRERAKMLAGRPGLTSVSKFIILSTAKAQQFLRKRRGQPKSKHQKVSAGATHKGRRNQAG
jgi:hypothetical protein